MQHNTPQKQRWRKPCWMVLCLSLGLAFMASGATSAAAAATATVQNQGITITGKVIDKSGAPIPGVNVMVKGSTKGTTTNFEGAFTIEVNSASDILAFTFVGMKDQEMVVGENKTMNIIMEDDSQDIDEVVVVGYGVQKKKDLSGSMAVVKADDMAKLKTSNALQALQGMAPGVSVVTNSGAPGSGATINIRGITTLNNNDPLYIIDGIPGDFSNVSPEEIESISILKDAAAAAIYGARAAGGVVLVQTKRGSKGREYQVSLSSNYTWQQVESTIEMTNAAEYKKVYAMVASDDPTKTDPAAVAGAQVVGSYNGIQFKAEDYAWNYDKVDANGKPIYANTNWQKEMFRQAGMQQHIISVAGGGENTNLSISGNYGKQDGVLVGSDFERKGIRINSDLTKKWLKIGESFSFNRKEGSNFASSGFGDTYDMLYALPHVFVRNSANEGGYGGYFNDMPVVKNPVGNALIPTSTYSNDYLSANVYAEISILKDLKFKSNGGFNTENYYGFSFTPNYFMSAVDQKALAELRETRSRYEGWIFENTLTYNKTIMKKHDVGLLLGYSAEREQNRMLTAKAEDFPYNDLPVLDLGKDKKEVGSNAGEKTMNSVFGRASYTFDGKYIVQANYRYDGSSVFGKQKRHGGFPSVSVAWNVTQEPFFKLPYVNDLKLRASYGKLGNDKIGSYQYVQSVQGNFYYVSGAGQQLNTGMIGYSLANESIQWEETVTKNIGADLRMFTNRLILGLDIYKKETESILVSVPLPLSFGGATSQLLNAASMENKGLELALAWRETVGKLSYGINGTFSTYTNKVTSLGGKNEPIWGGEVDFSSGNVTRTALGGSISEFYVWQADGLFQSAADVTSHVSSTGTVIQPNAKPGDIRWRDINDDGVIDAKDRTKVGSPIPKFEYSFGLNAAYSGFDMSMFFTGVYGNEIFNGVRYITERMNDYRNYAKSTLNAWTPTNTNTDMPRATKSDPNGNARVSSRYVEDGTYLRLKSIQLGYTLPKNLVAKAGVESCRVYLGGNNVFTITDYKGYDPEIVGGNVFNRGIDYGSYPIFSSYVVGFDIKF
jgi:TonB-linked SusC/RagA family outer membrane protein